MNVILIAVISLAVIALVFSRYSLRGFQRNSP